MSEDRNSSFLSRNLPEHLRDLFTKWSTLKEHYPQIFQFIDLINQHNVALFCGALSQWFAGNEDRLKQFIRELFVGDPTAIGFIFSETFSSLMRSQVGRRITVSPKVINYLGYAYLITSTAVLLYGLVNIWQCFSSIIEAQNITEQSRDRVANLKSSLERVSQLMVNIDIDWEALKVDVERGIFEKKRFTKFQLNATKLQREVDRSVREFSELQFDIKGKIENLEEEQSNTWKYLKMLAPLVSGLWMAVISVIWVVVILVATLAGFSGFVDTKVLEELRAELTKIRLFIRTLNLFGEKVEAMQDWVAENEDQFGNSADEDLAMEWNVVEAFESQFAEQMSGALVRFG